MVLKNPPPDVRFTQDQFYQLEIAGGVSLSAENRRDLENLGQVWCLDDLFRRSARPGMFRRLIARKRAKLNAAIRALDLNPENASSLERHFFSWFTDHADEDASALVGNAESLLAAVATAFEALENSLPSDEGRARPSSDKRRIQQLADIFERAGGKAKVYTSGYTEDGMANTVFRRFATAYYKILPLGNRRIRRGIDSAIIQALRGRRGRKKIR